VVYSALSFQQGLPVAEVRAEEVRPDVAHVLPARVARDWRVLPFRVEQGALFIASPEIPSPAMTEALQGFTRLELRMHLVPAPEFDSLSAALL